MQSLVRRTYIVERTPAPSTGSEVDHSGREEPTHAWFDDSWSVSYGDQSHRRGSRIHRAGSGQGDLLEKRSRKVVRDHDGDHLRNRLRDLSGIVTLVALAVAGIAGYSRVFGRASRYVETVSYSATFFFHWIPAIAETTTRLPPGAPIFPNAEAPGLQAIDAVLLVLFLVGATLQVRRLRAEQPALLAT